MKKEEKEKIRFELLSLLNEDSDWYKKENPVKEQRIRELMEQLCSFSDDVKEVDTWGKMTPYYYKRLRLRGISMGEICRMYGISKTKLSNWRADHEKELLKEFR